MKKKNEFVTHTRNIHGAEAIFQEWSTDFVASFVDILCVEMFVTLSVIKCHPHKTPKKVKFVKPKQQKI